MEMANKPVSDTADREIVLTRVLAAPRELVFTVWTDPKHISQWWGPRGFTTTTHEMDARPGGIWRFLMHGPDGTDYPTKIVYTEVVKPERLVYAHGDDNGSDSREFHVTVTFTESAGQTVVTMRMLFATAEERNQTAAFGAIELGNQTLERLAEHLANL